MYPQHDYMLFLLYSVNVVNCIGLFFNLFFFFFNLVLAVLGLRCCTWAFSSCGEGGLLFVVVRGLLIMVASLVAKHGL